MLKELHMLKLIWFTSGMLIGLTILSITKAGVPKGFRPSGVTNDTALYQSLSEIRAVKLQPPSFDAGIARLEQLESKYREKLPLPSGAPVKARLTSRR